MLNAVAANEICVSAIHNINPRTQALLRSATAGTTTGVCTHGCMAFSVEASFLTQLERHQDAGVSVVSLNVGFSTLSRPEHMHMLSFMRPRSLRVKSIVVYASSLPHWVDLLKRALRKRTAKVAALWPKSSLKDAKPVTVSLFDPSALFVFVGQTESQASRQRLLYPFTSIPCTSL